MENRTPRGERTQVECPECDAWTVLAPAEQAVAMALHAMDVAYPGASDQLSSVSVSSGRCDCGAQITLTTTRRHDDAPKAEA